MDVNKSIGFYNALKTLFSMIIFSLGLFKSNVVGITRIVSIGCKYIGQSQYC